MTRTSATLALGGLLAPASARANSMSGLVYVVVLWPLAALLVLALLVLAWFGWRKTRGEAVPSRAWIGTLRGVGGAAPAVLATATLMADGGGGVTAFVLTVGPVALGAVPCFLVAGKAAARLPPRA